MKKFDVTKPYEKEVLQKLHNLLTEMLQDFQRVCEKHGLSYFAVYGTAIGAVRHGGFIPWDDDLDVGMLREDFEKFLTIIDKEMGDKYQIMSPMIDKNCASSVVKLQRKGTKFISSLSENLKCEQCIFIDIFPFDNVAETEKLQKKQSRSTTFWDRLLYLCGTPYPNIPLKGIKGEIAALICWMTHYVLKILHISPRTVYKKFEKESTKYNRPDAEYVTCWGQPGSLRERFRKSDMFPLETVKYETGMIHILHNNDEALRKVYGDYMKIPDEKNRINHCPKVIDFGE